jgi:hypothetical protein
MGENDARDELVGHATLAILALLGMGLYSATYALVYAGSRAEASVVATLEFWMASVHLLSAVGCCACQALGMAVLQLSAPVPHVAEAQTALFLGVAAAVGTLSLGCIHGSSSGGGGGSGGGAVECGVYYGAAAVPRLASVGAVVWSVLVYAASLGCQSWSSGSSSSGGLSLGLRGASGVTATATMVTVPWVIQGALVRTCGDAWRVHLCAAVRIQVDANVTASTVSADCSHIDRSLGIALGGTLIALLFAWAAAALPPSLGIAPRKRLLLTGLSGGTALLTVLLVWALQPAGVRAPPPAAFHVLCAAFAGTTLCSSAWKLVTLRRRRATAAAATAAAAKRPPPPTASTSASLFARHDRPPPSSSTLVFSAGGGGGGDAARHRGAALPRRLLD